MEFQPLRNGLDELKPSVFGMPFHLSSIANHHLELLSEQQLASLIPPSLRYLLVVAAQRHPRYLLRILNSFDELYAFASVLIERHFLRTYGGGFTENFYGLKRERVPQIRNGEAPRTQAAVPELLRQTLRLRNGDIWRNLVILVGLPYLKRKLDESYEIFAPQAILLGPSYNRDALPPGATIQQRILYCYKWFLRNIYPSLNAAYYFSLLVFSLAYIFDNSKYSSPFLYLIGTRIRRMGLADHRAVALAAQSPSAIPGARPNASTSIFSPRTLATTMVPQLLSSARILLPTSIFALKFLEWWHASDFARQLSRKATEGLEFPPPLITGLRSQKEGPQYPKIALSTNTVALSSTSRPTTSPAEAKASPVKSALSTPRQKPPVSSSSLLPILTVPPPMPSTSSLCPICLNPIVTPTAVQTGFVFCYTCIFKWVEGTHERQTVWMEGGGGEEGWGEDEEAEERCTFQTSEKREAAPKEKSKGRRKQWESGKDRCPVTGRRVLGGTSGLRRVMV